MKKTIPDELINGFTMYNKIPILDFYIDQTVNNDQIYWNNEKINKYLFEFSNKSIEQFKFIQTEPYHGSAKLILETIKSYNVHNKTVAIIGSIDPWIEAICLNNGAKCITTVEFNVPLSENEKIKTIHYNEFCNSEELYDVIITYSSIEHTGLGRYGDPLDPDGDMKVMDNIHKKLKYDGILFWGAPIGADCVCFNAHRIYGKIRFPVLFEKFIILDWIGCDKNILNNFFRLKKNASNQPIVVAKRKSV